ncbi:aldo/keto reductase [Hyphomonas johnsonii]|uniref:Aldo/keto reductase family oxidoreductase n=1 Tax=Hyphomonas johnsonii MHS-2 TaxID=1280950 RepID=A0A059FTC6_9PROT|nr:aldo/keto reductase [Hyphomonas johnsonii]KCZ93862.1 aldo/keto reductase family oxidoreductase [Hyphomonas johnsonii MHS-2]
MSPAPRKLGSDTVYPVGLGCMNLHHGYGPPTDEADAAALLHEALDLGYNFLDTATIYGFGRNETLIGKTLKARQGEFLQASKCVLLFDGKKRMIDARPDSIKTACEASLKRLQRETIDLYYMHRPDPKVPIEDSMGAMADLVKEGKIRMVGLSEMGEGLLRRAHAVHPVSAMQSEYSLLTRNPEIAVLDACRELGVTFVPFSPVGRGYLADNPPAPADYHEADMRRIFPRWTEPYWTQNQALLKQAQAIAGDLGCTMSQLAIAWTLAKDAACVPIPGTTSRQHLKDNFLAADLSLSSDVMAALDTLFQPEAVKGPRYSPAAQASVDTEQFAFELS